ncbi:MAG: serine hydrolase [Bacteroidota bacterium]
MIRSKIFLLFFLCTGLLCQDLNAQRKQSFKLSKPEAQGVSSEGILNFVNAVEKSKSELHSFMLLRHGKVVAQGWWNPYAPGLKHTLYSCSKSFTATAIGFAVSEKLVSVNDKVISFFPDQLPDSISTFLSELTVKNLLTMSVGQEPDPTGSVVSNDTNWVRSFLALPILYKPGRKFLYNSLATYTLSAIVQKVTGQKIIDYLKPRLFDPLGITGMDWEIDPKGINTGGWGLRLKTEDMAKFAQLFLQKGRWKGKQILPAAWVEEASTMKIIQHPELEQSKIDASDWEQGYCYQMWRCRHNAYRGDGAFGQYMVVMPDQDAVLAITSETPDMQEVLNMTWQYLLPAMQNDKLPKNKKSVATLNKKLVSLALPLPAKNDILADTAIAVKKFIFQSNSKLVQSISFSLADNICTVNLATDTATYALQFANDHWQQATTSRRGPYLVAGAKAVYAGLPALQTAGMYHWKDKNTLALTLRYIESPHTEFITCRFEGNTITVDFESSLNVGGKKVTLKGERQM